MGAGDGSRTRDVQLGRLELYQLSYSRVVVVLLSLVLCSSCVLDFQCSTGSVDGEGFEPSKPVATDLQSVPFDRSGTRPDVFAIAMLKEVSIGAGDGTRTRNLLITNQLLYH